MTTTKIIILLGITILFFDFGHAQEQQAFSDINPLIPPSPSVRSTPNLRFEMLSVLLLALSFFLLYYFRGDVVIKRKLKKFTHKKISEFVDGEFAKVTGKVEFVGKPLISPLSGRHCAYYHILVEKKVYLSISSNRQFWETLIEEEVAGTFVIREGEYCAYIKSNNIKSHLVHDITYSSSFLDNHPKVLKNYLHQHGHASENFLGLNKTLKYKEGILEKGEVTTILGKGKWKDANQVDLPEHYGKVFVIGSTENETVYLSDDPKIVKNTDASSQ